MDGFNGANVPNIPLNGSMFWGLPVAFAMEESMMDRIGRMSDEEREVLREKSSQITNDSDMDELVRMVAEGRFE
ncbi:MAG: hypothetical protein ACI4TB_09250 [Lachnospiraceae bacterium]